jgi:hypothetical protein
MKIDGGSPIGTVSESPIDWSVAQLVETAPAMRRWFVGQAIPGTAIQAYLGATTHAYYADEGESDIEFGIVTESGDRHLILIENKIDAPLQPDQCER